MSAGVQPLTVQCTETKKDYSGFTVILARLVSHPSYFIIQENFSMQGSLSVSLTYKI